MKLFSNISFLEVKLQQNQDIYEKTWNHLIGALSKFNAKVAASTKNLKLKCIKLGANLCILAAAFSGRCNFSVSALHCDKSHNVPTFFSGHEILVRFLTIWDINLMTTFSYYKKV